VRLAFSRQTSAISFPFIPIPWTDGTGLVEWTGMNRMGLMDRKDEMG